LEAVQDRHVKCDGKAVGNREVAKRELVFEQTKPPTAVQHTLRVGSGPTIDIHLVRRRGWSNR
jgi:hypothetical protein